MSFKLVTTALSADVAASGTFDVSYPTGFDSGAFNDSYGHKMVTGGNDVYDSPGDFTLTFGTSNITVTLGSAMPTLAAGTTVYLQLELQGEDDGEPDDLRGVGIGRTAYAHVVKMDLGAPDTADTDAIVKAATGATELPDTAETISHSVADNGTSPLDNTVLDTDTIDGNTVYVFDVPRNITTTVTHASSVVAMTITIHGYDEYKVAMSETITVAATGTSQSDAGLKAFKYIKQVDLTAAADASANTVNVGFGDVLGLPVFLPGTGHVLREMEDGSAPTAGTIVAGDQTDPTATTGDVRGTYDPNSAANGSKAFALLVALGDASYTGLTQYAA